MEERRPATRTWWCLLLVLGALVIPAGALAQPPVSERAKMHFAVGVGLLEDPGGARYAEAYESFRRAYRASPSPKILSNLGLCAMHIERDGEAIEAYELYLAQVSDIPAAEKVRINSDLERLRAAMATLVLNVKPSQAIIIDERTPVSGPAVINRYQIDGSTIELKIRSGQHQLRVEAKGHKPLSFTADLAPGDSRVRKLRLVELKGSKKGKKPKSQPPGPNRALDPSPEPQPDAGSRDTGSPDAGGISGASIAMLIVTGAFTGGAIVVGVLALQAQSDYSAYESGGDRQEAEDVRATGEALNITTDVLIAAAAVSAVVSIVLLSTTSGSDVSAKLTVRPRIGGAGLGLDVRF